MSGLYIFISFILILIFIIVPLGLIIQKKRESILKFFDNKTSFPLLHPIVNINSIILKN